ncbi:Retinoic acid induced 16-like protein [Trinorchestia longiramus]|nr:Retinoic acid induced 16-like protein [Trinorchestia longiramus]
MSVAAGDSSRNGSSVGDWLRNSVARSSFGRRAAAAATNVAAATAAAAASGWAGVGAELDHVDPAAAYHTFTKHWQQTVEIMETTASRREVFQDDVTAVINHLRQMITLLQVDIRQIMTKDRPPSENRSTPDNTSTETAHGVPDAVRNSTTASSEAGLKKPYVAPSSTAHLDPLPTPIFDHFLGEEILDKVLEWSLGTGEFANSLKLEQLRIHEVLLSQSRQELLVYKPVIRPLIRLLDSCLTCIPVEVGRHLVLLLNQLCASLLHNQQLLHFFFLSSPNEQGDAKFLIFSLLLPFVHREGDLGQQARDALLLCMALSNTNPHVGQYIADTSNFCPLLAAGMCGLYSTLPRTLPASVAGVDDWHCITATDVPHIPNLQAFLNALEFCNAVVQVGHPVVRNELVELVYQGFLVLVLGPALHQDGAVSELQQDLAAPPVNIEEVVTATAYVDLFLSYATEPQLRRAFLAFLLTPPPRHSEDEQRRTEMGAREPPIITTLISRIHSDNSRVCLVTLQLFVRIVDCWCEDAMLVLMLQYLVSGCHVMVSHRHSTTQHTPTYDAHKLLDLMPSVLKHEEECRLCGDAAESCEGSSCDQLPYTHVLQEARNRISRVAEACSKWTWRYDGVSPSPAQAVALLEAARAIQPLPYPKPRSESDPTQSSSSDPAYNPLIVGVSNDQRRSSLPSSTSMVLKSPVLVTVSSSDSRSGCVNTTSADGTSGSSGLSTTTAATGSLKSCRSVSRRGGALPHPTILNLSHDDEQPESLGESSGYESFNFRTSRDSSPSSLPGSPHAPHRIKPATSSSSPDTGATDVDEEFLEELMAWDVQGDSDQNCNSLTTSNIDNNQSSDIRGTASESNQDSNVRTSEAHIDEAMREIDEAHAVYAPTSPVHTTSQDSDCDDVNWDEPAWSSPPSPPSSPLPPHARPTIGPFLEAVLERVEDILNLSIPVTQLLFALLLRLASCPAPILTTLLLHPSILCQPAVRSLYQVLGSAKQRIDACLTEDDAHLLTEARVWFSSKQQRNHYGPGSTVLMIPQHHHQTSSSGAHQHHQTSTGAHQHFNQPSTSGPLRPTPPPPPSASLAPPDPSKDGSRKRSLTAAVTGAMGALFKRGLTPQQQAEPPRQQQPMLQFLPHNAGFRYHRQPSDGSNASVSPAASLQTDSSPPTSLTSSPAVPHRGTPPSTQSVFYAPTLPESSSSLPVSYGVEACEGTPPSSQSLGSVLYSSETRTSSVETAQHRHAVHSYNPQKVHAARCAILLRQLLLSLSALAQEHAVYAPEMVFDFNSKNSTSGCGDASSRKSGSLERRTIDS